MPDMGIPQYAASRKKFSNIKMRPSVDKKTNKNFVPQGRDRDNKIDKNVINRINGDDVKQVYAEKKNELDKNDFLKFLTFQMQNQDPTKPMDQKKLTAELAQISQLEQMSGMRKLMEQQNKNIGIEKKFYASSLINKMATVDGALLNIRKEATPQPIRFKMDKSSSQAMVRVFDDKNNMVAQFEIENLRKGHNEVIWDSKRLDGQFAAKGQYTFNILAKDEYLQPIKVQTKMTGRIKGIEFNNGDTLLNLENGGRVSLRNVDKLEEVKDDIPEISRVKNLQEKHLAKGRDLLNSRGIIDQ